MVLEAGQILKQLQDLWRALGKPQSGNGEAVVRACAMTLLVSCAEGDDPLAVSETLAEVVREHPSRIVLVRWEPGAELRAEVTARCWLPFGQRQQICCEQIEITAAEQHIEELTPLLKALAAPDLPVVLWHRGRLDSPVLARWGSQANRVIVDSNGLPAPLLANRAVSDLAWTRLTRWRELIAQTFENPPCRRGMCEIAEIRVERGAGAENSARYLAAWLAGALGREPARKLLRSSDPGLRSVVLEGPRIRISLERVEDAIEIRAGDLTSRSAFPPRSEASLLKEELSHWGPDRVFEDTSRLLHAID